MRRRRRNAIIPVTRCRSKRQALGWTQDHLAKLANVPQPYISDIEHQKIDVRPEDLIAVAKVLGLEPHQLMEEVKP